MRNLQKWSLLIVLLISCPLSVLAQNRTLTGTVSDANGAVAGASVTVKGSYSGTVTDGSGKFTLSVPNSATALVVSFMGYEDQELTIGDRTYFEVTLEESSVLLDEVVAIGYAKVRRRDLTGAVSSVSGADLATVPAMTAAQALQGKAAGVNIVTAGGAPGAGVNVTIRGGTSITQSTKPLYIVDGFEMDDALTNININDIESIEVLKDASSTAIYGSRGSNGIILITTKGGKKGGTTVSYNTFFSFDTLSKKLDMMSNAQDYVTYQYELAELQGKTSNWSAVYDDALGTDAPGFYTGVYDRIRQRYADGYGIDWQDKVFGGSALTQSHNLSVSTGNDRTQLLLSYNHDSQDGLLENHSQTKNTFRARVNSTLYKGIRVDVNTLFTDTDRDGGGAYSGMKKVLLQPINGGTKISEYDLLNTQTYPDLSGLDSAYDTENPIIQNRASTSNRRSRLYYINAGLEFDFLKHFTWRTAGNYSWTDTKSTSFSDQNSVAYLVSSGTVGINGSIKNEEKYRYQVTNTLNYNQTFGRHKVNVLLGHEVMYTNSKNNEMKLRLFPYPNSGLDDISLGDVYEKSSGHSRNGLVSFFARANYTFDERYLLTATIRTDGSSKFARGNQWGVFPSVSGAWRVSEEKFWKNSTLRNTINSLKLRVGYGVTGNNAIGNNLYTTKIDQTIYPIGGNANNAAYIPSTTLGNKKLKWETLNATNVGLDISLFNSRVNVTAEWYNNEISDMLMKSVIPVSTGYPHQYQNVGKMRNRGWEFTVNTDLRKGDFRWTADLNLSFNKSKVTSLEYEQTQKTFSVGGNRTGTVNYYAVVGQRLGDMYGYIYDGVYTTGDFTENADGTWSLREDVVKPEDKVTVKPGDIKFAADNEAGDQFTKQMVKIGNGTPDMIGGFNNTFYYKGFDLSVFMKFSVGNDVYNATKHSLSPYAPFQNAPKEFGDNYYRLIDPATGRQATTLAGIQALNPDEGSRLWSLSTVNSGYITYPSSYYVEDGSYLRIAQATLGYTFPRKWMQKIKVSNARLYFTVNNLATITGYSGYDPEVTAGDSDYVAVTPGYDSSTYPRSRSYVIGLNLTF